MKRTEVRVSAKGADNRSGYFHLAIITSLLLAIGAGGCGYKTDPVWPTTAQKSKAQCEQK